jgi:hypothetical protein
MRIRYRTSLYEIRPSQETIDEYPEFGRYPSLIGIVTLRQDGKYHVNCGGMVARVHKREIVRRVGSLGKPTQTQLQVLHKIRDMKGKARFRHLVQAYTAAPGRGCQSMTQQCLHYMLDTTADWITRCFGNNRKARGWIRRELVEGYYRYHLTGMGAFVLNFYEEKP